MPDERKGLPSASRMPRIAACPGSVHAEQDAEDRGLVPDTKQVVAAEGDDIHEALATDDWDELGEDEKVITERLDAMIKAAKLDWHKQIRSNKRKEIPPTVVKEKRYWINDRSGKPVCSAQLDYAAIDLVNATALVIDTKTGYLDVPPSHQNQQIRTQVVALWRAHPNLRTIRGAIAAFRFREKFSCTDYTTADLVKADREITFLLARASRKDAERVPGDHCRYCKAALAGTCPENRAMAMLPAASIQTGTTIVKKADIPAMVAKLSTPELAMIQERGAMIRNILTSVSNRLRNLPEKELSAIGLKLVPTERKKPGDVNQIFSALGEAGLIEKSEMAGCVNIVLGRIMEIAVDRLMKQGVSTKKEATLRVKKLLDPFMETIPTAKRISHLTKEERKEHARKIKEASGEEASGEEEKQA